MSKKIATTFDDHDHDQLRLLARINKVRLTELVRRIVKAHLDKRTPNLAEERVK
jgi:hypothetical protein